MSNSPAFIYNKDEIIHSIFTSPNIIQTAIDILPSIRTIFIEFKKGEPPLPTDTYQDFLWTVLHKVTYMTDLTALHNMKTFLFLCDQEAVTGIIYFIKFLNHTRVSSKYDLKTEFIRTDTRQYDSYHAILRTIYDTDPSYMYDSYITILHNAYHVIELSNTTVGELIHKRMTNIKTGLSIRKKGTCRYGTACRKQSRCLYNHRAPTRRSKSRSPHRSTHKNSTRNHNR